MIKLLKEGEYTLIETNGATKILALKGLRTYAWVHLENIGEILVTSHKSHIVDHMLSMGKYRMYEVRDEPKLTDVIHLELLIGDGVWQGYLLPTGLPTDLDKRNRLIPTKEIITKSTI